jgi:hypothetical protein
VVRYKNNNKKYRKMRVKNTQNENIKFTQKTLVYPCKKRDTGCIGLVKQGNTLANNPNQQKLVKTITKTVKPIPKSI